MDIDRTRPAWRWIVVLMVALPGLAPRAAEPIHHELTVRLEPERHRLVVEDVVRLPPAAASARDRVLRFALHPALEVRTPTAGARLVSPPPARDGEPRHGAVPVPVIHTLHLPPDGGPIALHYEGGIHHPLAEAPGDEVRGVSGTAGTISPEGVFLGGASYWYPVFGDERVTFAASVHLPPGWDAVSQGERVLHERDDRGTRLRWEESHPQTEIHLVAGRYTEYARTFDIDGDAVEAMAFLRSPDAELAGTYLEATGRYLRAFSELLGPYPYAKFALVENFWETGYGMPSFTLLGGTVIRLPFIIHSSYPHEILHNWWGNGVYVDYARGNWAEGLTAYLADHWLQEQRGTGAEMRRGQLQRYADYVHGGRDFPLSEFRSRHSPASEAVGYGKAMMFFHMLRRDLGEEAFLAGMRDFYRERRFLVSGFEDLRRALARHAGGDLRAEFSQWVERTGAPRFEIVEAAARALDDGRYELRTTIAQVQPEAPYGLRLPLAVTLDGADEKVVATVAIREAREEVRLTLPARPLRMEVDPAFDVFRRVDRREIPPALSQSFGAERITAVLPADAPAALREGYRALAQAWRGERAAADFRIVFDSELDGLPGDRSVWLFGWQNRFMDELSAALRSAPVTFDGETLHLPEGALSRATDAVVLTARHPAGIDLALGWLGAEGPDVLPALARRLPHYGRYSYVGFGGPAAERIAAGQWPVTDSPMAREIR